MKANFAQSLVDKLNRQIYHVRRDMSYSNNLKRLMELSNVLHELTSSRDELLEELQNA